MDVSAAQTGPTWPGTGSLPALLSSEGGPCARLGSTPPRSGHGPPHRRDAHQAPPPTRHEFASRVPARFTGIAKQASISSVRNAEGAAGGMVAERREREGALCGPTFTN